MEILIIFYTVMFIVSFVIWKKKLDWDLLQANDFKLYMAVKAENTIRAFFCGLFWWIAIPVYYLKENELER